MRLMNKNILPYLKNNLKHFVFLDLLFWNYKSYFEIISHNHYLEKLHQPLGKYFSFLFCYTNLCQFIIWQILVTLVVSFFFFLSSTQCFWFSNKLDWILISTPPPPQKKHILCLDLISDKKKKNYCYKMEKIKNHLHIHT